MNNRKYNDLAVLNEAKAEIYQMNDQQLRHEAAQHYGLRVDQFDNLSELREQMILIEERNYFR